MTDTGVNHRDMNINNKYVILKALATQGAMPRNELSILSGLSKMAITAIANEYLEQGILRECGELSSSGGRKPKLLELNPNALLTLAISIDREMLLVGIVNARGAILRSEHIPFRQVDTNQILIDNIFYLCDIMMKDSLSSNFWGIGVSCVGPLSIEEGEILNPPDFGSIHNLPIVRLLKEKYNLPCYLQNDMCLAALAEAYYGKHSLLRNFLYIGISSGIGGGVILDRKLFTGTSGLAGIIGHSIVQMNGLPCTCGQRGCLEQYSSITAIVKWARDQSGDDSITWMRLAGGIVEGDSVSQCAIDRMAEYLYVAISNFQAAFDMQGVIIGGDLYGAKDYIVSRVRERLQSETLKWSYRRRIEVEGASFMSDASFIGTSALTMENLLKK
ncbi:MAG: ROK family protein [Lachnospiraceae bacterium]|nr:ROK family protein [Lachnospiraceae bacterium]